MWCKNSASKIVSYKPSKHAHTLMESEPPEQDYHTTDAYTLTYKVNNEGDDDVRADLVLTSFKSQP